MDNFTNNKSMKRLIDKIKNEFNNVPDFKIKEIKISLTKKIYVIFLETLCDSNKINDYILKNLVKYNKRLDLNSNVPGPNTLFLEDYESIIDAIYNGFTIVISKSNIIAVETRAEINRSISASTREPSLLGPEDSFVENYQINMGLIKRRLKTSDLKSEEMFVGDKTKTLISINYLDSKKNIEDITKIKRLISEAQIEGLFDVGTLINLIEGENKSVFPTIRRTERPDAVTKSLLNGKIVIIVDTSPFAIIIPTYLVDFINPINDDYVKSINVGFVKILRFLSFILSISMPGIFIAITNYNQETIPEDLLINFSMQQSGVPFPAIVEIIILLIICNILRESDLTFPSNFGSTISILGALIIGEAAVNAGIVSPIMIIIASLTFITSLIFTELEINNALRYYRYMFLFFASILGLYGIFIAAMIFFINVTSTHSLNSSYFYPIAPFNKKYFFESVLKRKDKKERT